MGAATEATAVPAATATGGGVGADALEGASEADAGGGPAGAFCEAELGDCAGFAAGMGWVFREAAARPPE